MKEKKGDPRSGGADCLVQQWSRGGVEQDDCVSILAFLILVSLLGCGVSCATGLPFEVGVGASIRNRRKNTTEQRNHYLICHLPLMVFTLAYITDCVKSIMVVILKMNNSVWLLLHCDLNTIKSSIFVLLYLIQYAKNRRQRKIRHENAFLCSTIQQLTL